MTLDEIADELYGLPLGEFTAERTRHEKQARQAKDRALAEQIHALAKPTVTAWLANQLARAHRGELEPLVELGTGMREATRRLAGDELRQLTRQRHQLVQALLQQARTLARAGGQAVSDSTARGLEDTLHAALVDEQAAAQLLAGRLTDALFRSGFGDTDDTAAAVPEPAPAPAPRGNRDDLQLRRAEKDLAEAEQALTDATAARDHAQAHTAEADRAAAAAEHQVAQLSRQLAEAEYAATAADRHRHELAEALGRAEQAVRAAERRHADARAHRDRVADSESG